MIADREKAMARAILAEVNHGCKRRLTMNEWRPNGALTISL